MLVQGTAKPVGLEQEKRAESFFCDIKLLKLTSFFKWIILISGGRSETIREGTEAGRPDRKQFPQFRWFE